MKTLPPSADFLDISKALGVLDHLRISDFERYRKSLTIPTLIQHILTMTYRFALLDAPQPIPMRIGIVVGRSHSVEVERTDASISVVLTRPDPRIPNTK